MRKAVAERESGRAEDEFVIPAGASREEDMYASDEEEVEGWGAGGKLQPLEARRRSAGPRSSIPHAVLSQGYESV